MSKGTALVTGASSGIGAELARKLASMEFDLVITARRKAQLEALAAELQGSISVEVIVADLAAEDGVRTIVDALQDREIQVDMLVNNAGVAPYTALPAALRRRHQQLAGRQCHGAHHADPPPLAPHD